MVGKLSEASYFCSTISVTLVVTTLGANFKKKRCKNDLTFTYR